MLGSDFGRDGWVRLGRLVVGEEELAELRDLVDRLIGRADDVHDLVGSGGGPARVAQVMAPARIAPELDLAPAVARARAAVEAHFGPDVTTTVAMVIAKPAHDGGEVPWHQDASYWTDEERTGTGASVWIALQDVDGENGCLCFVSGSHADRVVREHQPIEGNPDVHARELTPRAREEHVVAPVEVHLRAGEATLHDGFTLHASGPNTTDRIRRALVLSVRGTAATSAA